MRLNPHLLLKSLLEFAIPALIISFLPGPTYIAIFIFLLIVYLYSSNKSLSIAIFQVYLLSLLFGNPIFTLQGQPVQDYVYSHTPIILSLPIKVSYRFILFLFFVMSLLLTNHLNRKRTEFKSIRLHKFTSYPVILVGLITLLICIYQIMGGYSLKYKYPFFQLLQMLLVLPSLSFLLETAGKKFYVYEKLKYLLLGFIIFSVSFQGLLSIIQFIIKGRVGLNVEASFNIAEVVAPENNMFRSPGTLGHPNSLGVYLSIFMPSLIFLYNFLKKRKNWIRSILKVSLLFGIIGLFLSFSRWAWISFTVGLIIFAVFYLVILKNTNVLSMKKILFITTILLFVLYMLLPRFLRVTTLDSRIEIFNTAVDQMISNPVFGVGPGNSTVSLAPYRFNFDEYQYSLKGAHNTLILIGVESGLFVFLTTIIFIVYIVFIVLRNFNKIKRSFSMFYLLIMLIIVLNSMAYSLYIWDPFIEIFFVATSLFLASLDIERGNIENVK